MVSPAFQNATQLLNTLSEGDATVSGELLDRIYAELRALAGSHMANQAAGHTLQPTALVHEAFLKLVDAPAAHWKSQGHFFALASKAMRTILVDHARRKKAKKRGGDRLRTTLSECTSAPVSPDPGPDGDIGPYDVLDVNESLEALAQVDAELVQVLELRFFGGLTIPKMARTLEVSERTVERRLRVASAWLRNRIG